MSKMCNYLKKINKIFALLFIFLSGCAPLSPDSELSFSRSIHLQDQVNNNKWWEDFNDEQLNQLVAFIDMTNSDLIKNRLKIFQYLYKRMYDSSSFLPDIAMSGNFERLKDYKYAKVENIFSSKSQVKYEIDIFGKYFDKDSSGIFEYLASIEDYNNMHNIIVTSFVDYYFYLSYLRSVIDLLKKKKMLYSDILKIRRFQYENGKVSSQEVKNIWQENEYINYFIYLYEQDFEQINKYFYDIISVGNNLPASITFPNILHCKTINFDSQYPVSVLSNRPDVKAAEFRVQKALADIEVSKNDLYPSLVVDFGLSSSSENISNSLSFNMFITNISIAIPFFNWNKIKWNIKVSQYEYEIVKENFIQTLNSAINDIFFSYKYYRNALDGFDSSCRYYNIAIEKSDFNNIRYKIGSGEYIDVLYSKISIIDAQMEKIKSYYDVIKGQILIIKSLCGHYKKSKM